MRFGLDEDQLQLRKTLRQFLEAEQSLSDVRAALETGYDRAVWRRLVDEIGVTAVGLPEEVGGTGASLLTQSVIAAELGRALDPGPYLSSIVLVGTVLQAVGGPAADAWLAALVSGESTAAAAFGLLSGPGAGAGQAAGAGEVAGGRPVVTAIRDGEGWAVSGEATHVIHGVDAQDLLVLAATDAGPTLLRVAAADDNVTVSGLEPLDGTRPLARVSFSGAAAELIGEPGGAAAPVSQARRRARVLAAAEQMGGAERILEITTDYARTRVQFDRPIGSFQSIKHVLATAALENEAATSAVLYAAWAFDQDEPDLEQLSLVAAAGASEAYTGIAKSAIQVHGGIGFTWEHDAHLFLKRAMTGRQLFGTPEAHREALAVLLLDD